MQAVNKYFSESLCRGQFTPVVAINNYLSAIYIMRTPQINLCGADFHLLILTQKS